MNEEQFQAERRSGIGGSDMSAILGINPFGRTVHDVYMEKVGLAKSKQPSKRMLIGTRLEPVIAEWYVVETGFGVSHPGLLRHKEHNFLIGHLDGIASKNGDRGVLEIKTTDARFAYLWGEQSSDEVPDVYNIQVQHYMGLADLGWADIAVLIGGNDFRIYRVPRNQRLWAAMCQAAEEFWVKYVLPKMPPPIDGTESAKTLLTKLYPRDSGVEMLADAELDETVQTYLSLRDEAKSAGSKVLGYENKIKEKMGVASLLRGRGYRISWKATKDRKSIDYKSILGEANVPEDVIVRHTKIEQGSRPFRVNVTKE